MDWSSGTCTIRTRRLRSISTTSSTSASSSKWRVRPRSPRRRSTLRGSGPGQAERRESRPGPPLSDRLPIVPAVTVAVARPSARLTAVMYLAYFVIAGIGQVLAVLDPASALAAAVQVGGTMWYAIVALFLCRLFGDPTRGAGVLAIVSVVVGCVMQ